MRTVTPVAREADPYETWRARVRELREAAGLNVRQAAARADLSGQRWRNLERGYEVREDKQISANPSRATVIAIARALGDPISDALAVSGFKPATDTELAPTPTDPLTRIGTALPKIPPHQRELLATLAESLAHPDDPSRVPGSPAGRESAVDLPGRQVHVQDVVPDSGTILDEPQNESDRNSG